MGGRQREEGTQVRVVGIDRPIRFTNSLLNAGYGRSRLAGLCQPLADPKGVLKEGPAGVPPTSASAPH